MSGQRSCWTEPVHGLGERTGPEDLDHVRHGARGRFFPVGQAEASSREGWTSCCQGHFPVISSSKEKLRKVRIRTIKANTPTLANVGVTATARRMSAATRSQAKEDRQVQQLAVLPVHRGGMTSIASARHQTQPSSEAAGAFALA